MIRNKKYNYFYKITNTKSGEYYFGVHSTDDLDDGYLGSGTRIKEAIEKEGKENFNKEIIKFFSTITEALEEEARVVTKDLVDDPMCYNMVLGGGGYDNNSLTVIDSGKIIVLIVSSGSFSTGSGLINAPFLGFSFFFFLFLGILLKASKFSFESSYL